MKPILIFPQRGAPPPEQEGYVRDPGNPYLFRLAWVPCSHRTEAPQPAPGCCGRGHKVPWCEFWDDVCSRGICERCEAVKFPTNQE